MRSEAFTAPSSGLTPDLGVIEEFYVDVFIRRSWEVLRLRRLQNARLNAATYEALKKVLAPLVIEGTARNQVERQLLKETFAGEADDLAERWRAGHADAIEKVQPLLRKSNISMDEVMAEAMSLKMAEMVAFETLLRSAEGCVDSAVRELERRRSALAQYAKEFRQEVQATTCATSRSHGNRKLLSHKSVGVSGDDAPGTAAA